MVVVFFLIISVLATIGANILQPKSPRLRMIVRILSAGGLLWFVLATAWFAYGYTYGEENRQPLPDFYSYLWPIIYGMLIGPVITIIALVITVVAKIRNI